jgi:hypothetical protein
VLGGRTAERICTVVGCHGRSKDGGECPWRTQVVLGTVPRYVQAVSRTGRADLRCGWWVRAGTGRKGVGDGEQLQRVLRTLVVRGILALRDRTWR